MTERTFGETIQAARKAKDLSIRELARRSGISHPYLSQLENGKTTNPSYEIIGKIAKGLGVNIVELLNLSDDHFLRLFDGYDLSYTSITEMNDDERVDFGRIFHDQRTFSNITLDEISLKTGISKEDLELLEAGKLNRNLTEIESINLLSSFDGFEFFIVPDTEVVEKREFEIGNLILFNDKVHYKGKMLDADHRRLLFESLTKIMESTEK
ncbi:helix-turn-helix domain-containing protein [Lysinibacillus agricola]|uniref:helix-turn-helix domain-containing protein n=1 Tax=Lysinibacillus agricola TaxID=2590012 RepID=UPI003C2355DD